MLPRHSWKYRYRVAAIGLCAVPIGTHSLPAQGVTGAQQSSQRAVQIWNLTESKSAMTDEPSVVLATDALDEVRGWLDRTRPSLVVRCQERKLDVYLVSGMASHVENARGSHSVRYRIDTTAAVTESGWIESTDNEALFAPSPLGIAERLMSANTILMEWTPFNASPVQARFRVAGLETHRARLVAACPETLSPLSATRQAEVSDSIAVARAAYAASPEGRAAEAIAAFKSLVDKHPRHVERVVLLSSVLDGLTNTRGRDTHTTTKIAGVQGCTLTVTKAHDLTSFTSHDTAWVDLRTIAPAVAVRSLKPIAGWAVVLATESGAKTILTHLWMPRDRQPKVASYPSIHFPFDKEEVAREAEKLAAAAITACRTVPL